MNETDFLKKWESEKHIYCAWGKYVLRIITKALEDSGRNPDAFLKVPAKCRLKDDISLIDKAFYRSNKNYDDPYNQIEDKVGVRFIVLLTEEIDEIQKIINDYDVWSSTICKHYEEDREKNPLLFTYQSVHCILRPKNEIEFEGVRIPARTPCEVQIRTLLQHAHAELTHDAIYKSNRTIRPKVHRTAAKSMALIETTDEFFIQATKFLNYGPLEEHNILERLDRIYFSKTGIKSQNQKSSIIIWDKFEQFIDDNFVDNIEDVLIQNEYLFETIKERCDESALYQQSTILFVYWMLRKKRNRLLKDWPLAKKVLEPLAVDIGVSIFDD